MNLISRLKKLYMMTPNESIKHLISQYLLFHLNDLDKLTIKQLSSQLGISKSVISKFCLQSGCEQFSQFKSQLILDYQELQDEFLLFHYNSITYDEYYSFSQLCYHLFNNDSCFQNLLSCLKSTQNVIIMGSSHYISFLEELTTFLLIKGIEVSELLLWSQNEINKKIDLLQKDDVVLIVDPQADLNLYLEVSSLYSSEMNQIEKKSANCFFIGQPSMGNDKFHVITVPVVASKMLYDLFILLFSNAIKEQWDEWR